MGLNLRIFLFNWLFWKEIYLILIISFMLTFPSFVSAVCPSRVLGRLVDWLYMGALLTIQSMSFSLSNICCNSVSSIPGCFVHYSATEGTQQCSGESRPRVKELCFSPNSASIFLCDFCKSHSLSFFTWTPRICTGWPLTSLLVLKSKAIRVNIKAFLPTLNSKI